MHSTKNALKLPCALSLNLQSQKMSKQVFIRSYFTENECPTIETDAEAAVLDILIQAQLEQSLSEIEELIAQPHNRPGRPQFTVFTQKQEKAVHPLLNLLQGNFFTWLRKAWLKVGDCL